MGDETLMFDLQVISVRLWSSAPFPLTELFTNPLEHLLPVVYWCSVRAAVPVLQHAGKAVPEVLGGPDPS